MSAPVLSIRGLQARYGHTPVLEAIDLDVAAGEVVVVLGPSGAGKTTLFRCVTRLATPTAGTVEVGGVDLIRARGQQLRRGRRQLSVISQGFDLIQRRTALDNVLAGRIATAPLWRVLTGVHPDHERRRCLQALTEVGLAAHAQQRVDRLSGGQRQRVAIARALAQESRLVLADEPVASLDPASGAVVLTALRGLAERHGVAVLCSLHQVERVGGFADRVVGLRDGTVVFQSTADELDDREVAALYA